MTPEARNTDKPLSPHMWSLLTSQPGRPDGLLTHPDLLRLVVVENPNGGYDVALRFDGTYRLRSVAEEVARDYWAEVVHEDLEALASLDAYADAIPGG